jgi:DNA-binding PadR family transcriptional regulator
MTAYEIRVLLHYHMVPDQDHPDIQRAPPIWRPTIEKFQEEHLLQMTLDRGAIRDVVYEITDRGRAYCERLQTLPLPEQTWGYQS